MIRKKPVNPRGQANTLSKKEYERLNKVCSQNFYGKRDILLVLFSFGLGLRALEMAALRISDVFNEDETIPECIKLPKTKNNKARTAYLSDSRIRDAIKDYIKFRKDRCEKKRTVFSINQPLFLSQKGGHFSPVTMVMLFKSFYEKSGIKASSHSGRRTFATNLIEKGMDIRAVQDLMGHANINQTAKYVQGNPERLKRITENALY